jgi:hypothetical protein
LLEATIPLSTHFKLGTSSALFSSWPAVAALRDGYGTLSAIRRPMLLGPGPDTDRRRNALSRLIISGSHPGAELQAARIRDCATILRTHRTTVDIQLINLLDDPPVPRLMRAA